MPDQNITSDFLRRLLADHDQEAEASEASEGAQPYGEAPAPREQNWALCRLSTPSVMMIGAGVEAWVAAKPRVPTRGNQARCTRRVLQEQKQAPGSLLPLAVLARLNQKQQ